MLNAFLVALAVFICVGGAELVGFTMLNRPIVIGPLVGLFLGDLHTGVIIGASLEAVFMGVVNIGGASAAEPGIATAVGTAFAIMLGKGSEVALTLALPIGILGLQIKTFLYIFLVGMFAKEILTSWQQKEKKNRSFFCTMDCGRSTGYCIPWLHSLESCSVPMQSVL